MARRNQSDWVVIVDLSHQITSEEQTGLIEDLGNAISRIRAERPDTWLWDIHSSGANMTTVMTVAKMAEK